MAIEDRKSRLRFVVIGLAGVVAIPMIYFASLAPVLMLSRDSKSPVVHARVCGFYRPLFRNLPNGLMQSYVDISGYSDVEAFFLVQALQSDEKLELGPRELFSGFELDP